jgi:hypothetical protein
VACTTLHVTFWCQKRLRTYTRLSIHFTFQYGRRQIFYVITGRSYATASNSGDSSFPTPPPRGGAFITAPDSDLRSIDFGSRYIASAQTSQKTPLPTVLLLLHVHIRYHGNVFTEPLPSNGCLLWFCYPGFQHTYYRNNAWTIAQKYCWMLLPRKVSG